MVVKRQNSYLQELISNWNKPLFGSCFCLLLASTGLAQTVILGTAPGFEESKITAYSYHNYITSAKKEIASSTVDLGGSFVMTLPEGHDELVLIDLELLEFQLFATTEKRYVVEIGKFSSNTDLTSLRVVEAPDNDLNKIIPEFEERYGVLADSLYRWIIGTGKRLIVDSVFDALADSSKEGASEYMKTYVDYNIALIKQMTHKSKVSLFEQDYIINRPVRENNIAYMSFINQYFDDYFEQMGMRSLDNALPDLVNKKKDVDAVLKRMARNEALANDTLRELVLLKSLYEVYYDPTYSEQMVLDMIDSLASKTKIETHVDLAENIKSRLSQLRKGSSAPKFSLVNGDNEKVALSDLVGKYVYISFWSTSSVPSLLEMKVMPSLVKKYGDKISFVYISIDKEITSMNKFLKSQNLIIPENKSLEYYLHYGRQKSILTDYRIQSVPHYVFLDRGGKVLQIPAQRPSGNIELMFTKELLNNNSDGTISDPGGR